eukprot:scaffold12390_cov35-Phaeocystis_antarctica.AAC.2
MCFSTASDARARKWADAHRSMTDAHGQLWHVQAALWQVLVKGDPPCRRRRNAFWHACREPKPNQPTHPHCR